MARSLIVLLAALALGCGGRTAPRPGIGEGEAEAEAEADGSVPDAPARDASADVPDAPVGGEMVLVPAGAFWMGCNEEVDGACHVDEHPYHEVTLSAFRIDRTEVTVAAYATCVDAGACSISYAGAADCNWGMGGRETHPMNCVSWFEARDYCAWAGKALPTEAQWEKAARGVDGRRYPWGNEPATCVLANYWPCIGEPEPVGSHPSGASACDALDMAGNVTEWVADWHDGDYYSSSPSTDPSGPASGSFRVSRGGSWGDADPGLRVSDRSSSMDPSAALIYYGFRCASDP